MSKKEKWAILGALVLAVIAISFCSYAMEKLQEIRAVEREKYTTFSIRDKEGLEKAIRFLKDAVKDPAAKVDVRFYVDKEPDVEGG